MEQKESRLPLVVVYGLLTIIIVAASYTFYDMANTRKAVLHTFMLRPLESIRFHLEGFFTPIIQLSDMAIVHAQQHVYDIRDTASVNTYFSALLDSYGQVTSMGVADSTGYEYDVLTAPGGFRTRSVRPGQEGGINHWGMWSGNGHLDSIWSEPMRQDPRTRPWYKGAVSMEGGHHWTGPYLFNTDTLFGVTLSTAFRVNGDMGILALDVTLHRLSQFTSALRIGQYGRAFLLTRDMEHIGLPVDSTDRMKALAMRITEEFVGKRATEGDDATVKVAVNNVLWCARFIRFDLDHENYIYAAVAIPEVEMMAEVNRTTNVILLGMIIAILFTVVLLALLLQLRKVNTRIRAGSRQIRQQSAIIAFRNSELQESLNYAQRIQEIMLPLTEHLSKRTMHRLMVLYMPKETVSGDFYWGRHRADISYFAVADCTGHGVPGAMMSILGLDLLNASVGKDTTSLPENLLFQLRQVLIKRMRSRNTIARDGMDIGLCRLDHNAHTLHYAGAFIPLIIIRQRAFGDFLHVITDGRGHDLSPAASSDTHHLFTIKADRMPLGFVSHGDKGVFTGHQVTLKDGDSVYMMSDGYADQFGGDRDRKFGQRRLRQTLLSVEPLTMEDRRTRLRDMLLEHMGEREQVDDICIMGFCFSPEQA